jgi:hypothetical protein
MLERDVKANLNDEVHIKIEREEAKLRKKQ